MNDTMAVAADAKKYICSGDAVCRPTTIAVIDVQIPSMTNAA